MFGFSTPAWRIHLEGRAERIEQNLPLYASLLRGLKVGALVEGSPYIGLAEELSAKDAEVEEALEAVARGVQTGKVPATARIVRKKEKLADVRRQLAKHLAGLGPVPSDLTVPLANVARLGEHRTTRELKPRGWFLVGLVAAVVVVTFIAGGIPVVYLFKASKVRPGAQTAHLASQPQDAPPDRSDGPQPVSHGNPEKDKPKSPFVSREISHDALAH
jgi:hypothetical protein